MEEVVVVENHEGIVENKVQFHGSDTRTRIIMR
jgi:hypothetical protein